MKIFFILAVFMLPSLSWSMNTFPVEEFSNSKGFARQACGVCSKKRRKCDRRKPICGFCESNFQNCYWPPRKKKSLKDKNFKRPRYDKTAVSSGNEPKCKPKSASDHDVCAKAPVLIATCSNEKPIVADGTDLMPPPKNDHRSSSAKPKNERIIIDEGTIFIFDGEEVNDEPRDNFCEQWLTKIEKNYLANDGDFDNFRSRVCSQFPQPPGYGDWNNFSLMDALPTKKYQHKN